jgi:hypothetical protein
VTEIFNNASFSDFTLESLKTPSGVEQLNAIIRQVINNIAGDTDQVRVFTGVGTPEAAITAGIGSLYLRTDGGTDTSVYRKESGSGNTGWVAIKAPATLPLSVANGGTGSDLSGTLQGNILYFSATGVLSVLAPGTSGYFLKTQGASANPTWAQISIPSNTLFTHNAHINIADANNGLVQATALNDTTTAGKYVYAKIKGTTLTTCWSTKWTKISGVSTITVLTQMWRSGNTGTIQVNVGTANASTTDNTNATPDWKTLTIDVSGLSNGTTYDVTVQLSNSDVNSFTYFGELIAFGS